MSRYYCPYCSAQLQFHTKQKDGTLVCGQCGDPLIKKPFIKPIQIIAIISIFAFISPLIIMVFTFIKDQSNQSSQKSFGATHLAIKSLRT